MRTSDRSENMYASIDLVADGLARKLRKFKERKKGVSHESAFKAMLEEEEEEDDDFVDDDVDMYDTGAEMVVNMDVVKQKSFNMEPISVADAVLCLEYIDHDFYVFRNKDSGEVNVVYKR